MREFTCIVCGEKGVDKSPGQDRKFCSLNCSAIHWRKARGIGLNDERPPCLYNEGVVCTNPKCSSCGWNPEVAKKRMEAVNG